MGARVTAHVLTSLNEHSLADGYRRAALQRLGNARRIMQRAQGRGGKSGYLAERELHRAKAEIQSWGVAA